ncbi:MAG TPA: RelA/SpoT domain protein [Clostridiales bacterium]|nr:RelA/SpoT domain protein [Clostridiales bacterium]
MTQEEFYGPAYETMKKAEGQLLDLIALYSAAKREREGVKPVVYCCSRIKTPDSMLRKLEKRGLAQTADAALQEVFDAVGVRAVCAFAEDVYRLVRWLQRQPVLCIMKEKDYYAYPKPNGYRSYHILLKIADGAGKGCRAEIQVRTIANDFWATLEHQIKYKKDMPNEKLIRSELKRCADEIASVDLSMQTIRDIIRENA